MASGGTALEAIERLYQAFKQYRFTDMEGDVAFAGSCDPSPLLAKPLRKLSTQAFNTFAWKTMSTWGTTEDFRHFLPRMLELLYNHYGDLEAGLYMLEAEFLFGKLAYGKWRAWPSSEVEAIESFIHAWWIELIGSEISLSKLNKTKPGLVLWSSGDCLGTSNHVRSFLIDITYLQSSITDDLEALWAQAIANNQSLGPITNLAAIYINQNEFGLDQLGDWYKQPERCEALYKAWFEYQDHDPLGSFFSDAHANAELICSK